MEFSAMIEEEEGGEDVGFEEGRVWLPAHVLDEAWELKESLRPRPQQHHHNNNNNNHHHHHQRHHHRHHRHPKTSFRADPSVPDHHHLYHYNSFSTKSSSKILYHSSRPRFPGIMSNQLSTAGTGMQAVFLESGQRTCGTGFFLPRRAGSNTFQPNKKPVCSPVLLPSRVVQALNLNVHELGSQLTPRRGSYTNLLLADSNNNNMIGGRNQADFTSNKNDSDDDDDDNDNVYKNVSRSTRFIAPKGARRSCSPETFLPKEWSY